MQSVKEAEEMVSGLTDAQKKIWSQWYEQIQDLGKFQATGFWERTMDIWSDSVKSSLNAQVDWSRTWSERITPKPGVPEELVKWAQQGQEMIMHGTEIQSKLWNKGFETLKKLKTPAQADLWDKEWKKLLECWEEASQKAIDAQTEWVGACTEALAGEKPKGEEEAKA